MQEGKLIFTSNGLNPLVPLNVNQLNFLKVLLIAQRFKDSFSCLFSVYKLMYNSILGLQRFLYLAYRRQGIPEVRCSMQPEFSHLVHKHSKTVF